MNQPVFLQDHHLTGGAPSAALTPWRLTRFSAVALPLLSLTGGLQLF